MVTYEEALRGRDPDVLFEAALKEARAQVTVMKEWMAREKKLNPEAAEINEIPFKAVGKAYSAQRRIYRINPEIVAAEDARDMAGFIEDEVVAEKEHAKYVEKIEQLKASQMGECWRIRKIYMLLSNAVPLFAEVQVRDDKEEEYTEYEYDPE